jgi:predicted adenine nucleotide alpha hydrolase (AANH) superfamily ATPase
MSLGVEAQGRVRLLLHICCGPCACGALPFWQKNVTEVLGFFFNPNIHPLLEHRRRLTGAREAAGHAGVALLVDEAYDPEAWFAEIREGEGSRCERCLAQRLNRAAEEAVAQGCDTFSTSLSISPWQDHQAIETQGEYAARRHGVDFRYEDLRPVYEDSRRLSRERGIYRQKYCGCLVSEWERYRGRP